MHLLARSGDAILPFAEACPEAAAKIDAIIHAAPTVKLYYLNTTYEALPPSFKKISDVNSGGKTSAKVKGNPSDTGRLIHSA